MNFSYAVIAIVGVLVAITLGFIAVSPDDIPESRVVDVTALIVDIDESKTMDKVENPIACTMQYDPQCGIDGETYGNLCMMDAANVKLDYSGECVVPEPEVVDEVMEPEVVDEVMEPEVVDEVMEPEVVDEVMEPEVVDEVMEPEVVDEVMEPEVVDEVMEPEVVDEVMEPEVVDEVMEPEVVDEVMEPEVAPMTAIVTIPPGAAVPGCDDTDECYLPYEVTVATGATVLWSNDDSAAHTVSSGTVDAGLTGVFDSGLFMAGGSFEFTFDTPGTYDYFCLVHPWMTGIVSVS